MIDIGNGKKVRALVVDDSVLMGIQITKILSSDERIEVVGRAKDGIEAIEMVERLDPDVVTLDVEMPRMDGITALKHIMVRHPVPVIMVSSLTREGSRATFDALRFGALDVVAKPSRRETESLEAQAEDIIIRVRQAAAIGTNRARYRRKPVRTVAWKANKAGPPDAETRFVGVAVGGGGYSSLLQLIPNLRADFSHTLIAMIHVSNRFVDPLVSYLEGCGTVPVKSVRNVSHIEKGHCYICCSHDTVTLTRDASGHVRFETAAASGEDYRDGAIDAMFTSLAQTAGRRSVGIVMSGSGRAGAEGMAAIRRAGGVALVQSLATCMNPSMPRSILLKGAVDRVVADYLLADYLMGLNHSRAASGTTPTPIGRTAAGEG